MNYIAQAENKYTGTINQHTVVAESYDEAIAKYYTVYPNDTCMNIDVIHSARQLSRYIENYGAVTPLPERDTEDDCHDPMLDEMDEYGCPSEQCNNN